MNYTSKIVKAGLYSVIATLSFMSYTQNINNNVFASETKLIETKNVESLSFPIQYKIASGDTIESISDKFKINKTWIIKSNIGLISESETLQENLYILIPHIDGIAYKVLKGDDISKILRDFGMSKEEFLKFNKTLEVNPNDIVVFPATNFMIGEFEKEENYSQRFVKGNCTWYVASQIPGIDWGGDAKSWISNATKNGHTTGDKPIKGSIVQMGGKGMRLGHVGVVEEVYENGSFKISEMNYKKLGVRSERIIEANNKTIQGFIYLGEAKSHYLALSFEELTKKSNIASNNQ